MTHQVANSIKRKHALYKKWKKYKNDSMEDKYKKQANKASKLVKRAKRNFERKIAKNIKKRLKIFF